MINGDMHVHLLVNLLLAKMHLIQITILVHNLLLYPNYLNILTYEYES